MMSSGAFTAILIIGILLLFVGIMGIGFAPLDQDGSVYMGIAVFGVLMIVGAIIYLMVQSASQPVRRY